MTTPLPPTDPPSADEPLPGEAELAELYRQLPQNAPSPALDAIVLRAAAAALTESDGSTITERRKGPREPGDWVHPRMTTQAIPAIDDARRRARTPRWLITLGSAASLVLVAGLAWQMRESSPPSSASVVQQAAVSIEGATAAKTNSNRGSAPSTAAPTPAAAPAAQLADQQATMQAAAAMKVKQDGELRSAQRQQPTKAMAALPPAAERAAPAPAVAAAAPPAPPAPPAPVEEVSANATDAPSATKPAPPAATSVAVNESTSDKHTAPQAGDTPAQALDKIQQLFAQGHRDEALQRLRGFHKAHPQWPLSSTLQAHLREP